jgi:hypothetical protein
MKYPHYSVWRNGSQGAWEVVRWDDFNTWEVVQTNIYTKAKAKQALADWKKRASPEDTTDYA